MADPNISAALLETLRTALVPTLAQGSWSDIESDHRKVELPWREDLKPGWGKPGYVARVLDELSGDALVSLAERCLVRFPDRCGIGVQDALWWIEARGNAAVTVLTRQALADALDGRVMHPREHPVDFLRRFAVPRDNWGPPPLRYDATGQLCSDASTPFDFAAIFGGRPTGTPEWVPYAHRELLEQFGYLRWPDRRLFRFVEALVDPAVRQGDEQREWVTLLDGIFRADGYTLREVRRLSNRPVYAVLRADRGVDGRPKNLIFASTGPKPELGFKDAINNDVVILRGAESCLVYDESLSDDGLRWVELVAWWAAKQGKAPTPEVRRELGRRLRAAAASPPEGFLFDAYFRVFSPRLGDRLPALVPQVYLHFDPATAAALRQRGEERRFLTQRMDFLLLLPHRVRVVLEVDGRQHYADGDAEGAKASPARYAQTVRGDRDLRLDGYEVYRFGGQELYTKELADATVEAFFVRLFQRHALV
jgi:very-short-patch-repair endonuclease